MKNKQSSPLNYPLSTILFQFFSLCRRLSGIGFRDAALLEYSQAHLDYLQKNSLNHHYGEWDKIFISCGRTKPVYDLWLDKHESILKAAKDTAIIDLGCGYGSDTLYLHERGYKCISCDLSGEALKRLKYFIADPITIQFDMLGGLPFKEGSAKVVIADLSIHYFPWEDTKRIVKEIGRVLTNGGYFLCRVNSVNDVAHGSGRGEKIEENYYDVKGRKKRFFNKEHLEELFGPWSVVHKEEYSLERFGTNKVLWEIVVQKIERV